MLSVGENNFFRNKSAMPARLSQKARNCNTRRGNSIELYGQATFWKDSLMRFTHQSGLPPVYGLLMACEKLI